MSFEPIFAHFKDSYLMNKKEQNIWAWINAPPLGNDQLYDETLARNAKLMMMI